VFRAWPNCLWIPNEIEECPRYWNFWMWFHVDNSNIQRRASSYRSASIVEDLLWSRISIPQQWVKIIFNRPHLSISTRRYHPQYASLKCPRIRIFDPLNPWTYAENAHHSYICVLIKSSFPSSPKSWWPENPSNWGPWNAHPQLRRWHRSSLEGRQYWSSTCRQHALKKLVTRE